MATSDDEWNIEDVVEAIDGSRERLTSAVEQLRRTIIACTVVISILLILIFVNVRGLSRVIT